MLGIHEKYGSWDTRKNYKPWSVTEINEKKNFIKGTSFK